MHLKKIISSALLSASLLVCVGTAQAQLLGTAALSTAGPSAGNQSFSQNLGLNFSVTTGNVLQISGLGIFDDDADGLAGSTVRVSLYQLGSNFEYLDTPAITTYTFSGTGVPAGTYQAAGSYIFANISPVYIGPGNYAIMAAGYTGGDLIYNAGVAGGGPAPTVNTGGGVISYGQVRYNTNFSDAAPDNSDVLQGPSNRFGAFSFAFSVPEPGTMSLLGVAGLPMLALLRRRRH